MLIFGCETRFLFTICYFLISANEVSTIVPRSEEDIQRLIAERKERLKELTCINETTQIIKENRTIDETLVQIVKVLPRAWQYPEMTTARIWFEGKDYPSPGFR